MRPIGSNEILQVLLSLFLLYVVSAMFVAEAWVIYRLAIRARLLPDSPLVTRRPAPWGIWTVLLTLVLYVVVHDGCVEAYGRITGRQLFRPPAPARAAAPPSPVADPDGGRKPNGVQADAKGKVPIEDVKTVPKQPVAVPDPASPIAKKHPVIIPDVTPTTNAPALSMTEQMVIGAAIDVILLFMLPLLLIATTRSPLRDLGLSFTRWWQQAAVGIVALLAIQPVVYGVQFAMTTIWENHTHPLQKMVLEEFSPGVPQLSILLAVVVAPVFEEIMFRGIIQSWLIRLGTVGRHKRMKAEAENAAITPIDELTPDPDWDARPAPLVKELAADSETMPSPQPEAVDGKLGRRRAEMAGIVLTSLIFAAVHGPQWPAPIPLFILSVVIGYVYQRTGSLIAAICMHAAFNGFSTILLLGILLSPQSAQHLREKNAKPGVFTVGFSGQIESAWISCEK